MPNNTKRNFLDALQRRFGRLHRLERSQSLFELADSATRIYVRYSRVHPKGRTFYGLRQEDLQQLEGHDSLICFLWTDQKEPLGIPFSHYEEVFQPLAPARDGQYKVQVFVNPGETELYIARAGRFNVEAHMGWRTLETRIGQTGEIIPTDISHSQVQTMLGAIGIAKEYEVWIPLQDRDKLDWSLTRPFSCQDVMPPSYGIVAEVLEQVDVVWMERGSSSIGGLYEVEHTTPIYSALLRFNDIHLTLPGLQTRYVVVADDSRRALFSRQLSRPTFVRSRLAEVCTFLEYDDVYRWYLRLGSG